MNRRFPGFGGWCLVFIHFSTFFRKYLPTSMRFLHLRQLCLRPDQLIHQKVSFDATFPLDDLLICRSKMILPSPTHLLAKA